MDTFPSVRVVERAVSVLRGVFQLDPCYLAVNAGGAFVFGTHSRDALDTLLASVMDSGVFAELQWSAKDRVAPWCETVVCERAHTLASQRLVRAVVSGDDALVVAAMWWLEDPQTPARVMRSGGRVQAALARWIEFIVAIYRTFVLRCLKWATDPEIPRGWAWTTSASLELGKWRLGRATIPPQWTAEALDVCFGDSGAHRERLHWLVTPTDPLWAL